MQNLFLKIFFATPLWLLKLITRKKQTLIRGQILDYQTQIFLSLQDIDIELSDDDDVVALRREISQSHGGLPLNAKPSCNVTTKDHELFRTEAKLMLREYVPDSIIYDTSVLYFHGGGYVLGSIDGHDAWLKFLASNMQARVFSLEYSLAPEKKYPVALEDSEFSLEWIAEYLKAPISNISLCGDSAGAHLAASLSAHRSINQSELPKSQFLIYPMTDPSCESKSQSDFSKGYFLTRKNMKWFWKQFTGSSYDIDDPRFNLLVTPPTPMPHTMIVTAGFDPLSDEAEVYARTLFNAGVEVNQIHYPHLIHGFVNMTALRAAEKAALDLINSYKASFET